MNIDVLRVIRWIGLEPSVAVPGRDKKVTVYGFHSLRHSFASFCAEAGIPQATVTSILGADSNIVAQYYTHVGDEAQQQAIAAVTGSNLRDEVQKKIDEALNLINTSTASSDEILAQVKAILEK